jgi:hypothetical protein
MKFSATQHRQMSRCLEKAAKKRKGKVRRKMVTLAPAFEVLAQLAEAASTARGRPIAAAKGHRVAAWPKGGAALDS